MTYDKDDLDDMLEFLSRGGDPEEAPEGHLSVQELTSYGDGEMSPEEARRIEEHLAACPECSNLRAGLAGFFAPPPSPPERVAEFEAAADWRKLRSRLDEDGWFDRGRRLHRRQRLAIAAVFLLALVGLYFYGFHVPSQKYQTLPPLDMERGSGSRPVEEVRLPTNLLIKPPLRESLPEYKARFLDENG
ncbi:MAG TPA: zf-HC2 domain-containing protein, partial [Thermoanaerobaculia bacterium]|nr:zf-HC2 domain-containing protein [Thermoanaerobaculia bacterium]